MKRIIKRAAEKAQRAFDKTNKVVATVATGAVIAVNEAAAAVVMPTPAYTDIEAAAVVGFSIAITVALLMKAKSFFK